MSDKDSKSVISKILRESVNPEIRSVNPDIGKVQGSVNPEKMEKIAAPLPPPPSKQSPKK